MDIDEATALLRDPARFCDAAAALAKNGDPKALPALVTAYDSRAEGGKVCLLDAMEALDAKAHAASLLAEPSSANAGYRLMGLFPDDRHLPALVAGLASADPKGRFVILRSLGTQLQTDAWEAAMIGLLDDPRLEVRSAAVDALSRRNTDVTRAALSRRRDAEPDPKLKARLEMIAP